MKKFLLLTLIYFSTLPLFAQNSNNRSIVAQEKVLHEGYTITLISEPTGTFGYTLAKGDQFLVFRPSNPFIESLTGLKKKEDALKVAKWEIKEIKAGKSIDKTFYKLDKKVAEQLQIDLNQ